MIRISKAISIRPLIMLASLGFLTIAGVTTVQSEKMSGWQRATFAVHCYDVGAHALKGQTGVVEIQRGWQGREEVDRVLFNPQQVSLEQLETRLKESDTYIRTITVEPAMESDMEMTR